MCRISSALVEPKSTLRIGARPSPLAQIQAKAVSDALQDSSIKIQTTLHTIRADGDHTTKAAGTQSLPLAVSSVDFTGSLDEALLSDRIDVAVHSLKDVPPTARWRGGDALRMAGYLAREDARDVLVAPYPSIADLPPQARVGTSSIRRQSQLLGLRPNLDLVNLRGNVQTRLGALEDGTVDGLILAQAGLNRLMKQQQQSSDDTIVIQEGWCHPIPFEDLLSGACQGIVVAVCRADDKVALDCLSQITDEDSSIAAAAERAFLDALDSFSPSQYEGSTGWTGRPPLAALMKKSQRGWIFEGLLARPDGSKVIRKRKHLDNKHMSGDEAARIGMATAEKIMNEAGLAFYQ